MPKSSRRSFIDLAEAVRTLNEPQAIKALIAEDVRDRLAGVAEGFDPDRFIEHALSTDPEGKWAYNRRTGEGYQGEGDESEQIDLSDFDEHGDPRPEQE